MRLQAKQKVSHTNICLGCGSIRHKRIPSHISSNLHRQSSRHEPSMRSTTAKIPYTRMADRFSQPSDLTFGIETKEIIEVGGGVRAHDGSHALAEIASEACGEDDYIGIDFCAIFEAEAGSCV